MYPLEKRATAGWFTIPLAVVVLGSALFFVSCYPGEELTVSDLDVVATFFEADANFATKLDYAMPAMIFDLNDSTMQTGPEADAVLAEINENMTALGFTNLGEDTTMADVVLVAFKTSSTWISGGCYPTYYPYYWGWCYPVAYSYQTGTFLLVMLDRQNRGTEPNAIWVAGINGVLEGSTTASLTTRLNNGINQAFEQSPYLGEGK
jgi:hypothetical protein